MNEGPAPEIPAAYREMIDFLLPPGAPLGEVVASPDFGKHLRLVERRPGRATALHWDGPVVAIGLDESERVTGHHVERVRRLPPPGTRPGRGRLPVRVRTWGELLAVLRSDRVAPAYTEVWPLEVEVHGEKAGPRGGPVLYRFVVADAATLASRDPADLGRDGPSALDAAEWLLLADGLERSAPAGAAGDADLALADACWAQVEASLDGDEVTRAPERFTTLAGHAFREAWPDRFTRAALASRRAELRRRRAG